MDTFVNTHLASRDVGSNGNRVYLAGMQFVNSGVGSVRSLVLGWEQHGDTLHYHVGH